MHKRIITDVKNGKISVESVLIGLGLTGNQARTYSALLDLGSASIRKIAERTGINRGTTYEALKDLVVEGLVSLRQTGKRQHYVAESPERIEDIIRGRRKDLLQARQDAQKLIPVLLARRERPEGGPLVRYYQDDEGVVTILRDVLQTCIQLDNPEYHVYSSGPLRHYLYRKFPKFTEQRIKEGIFVKVIAVGQGGDPAELSERRWIKEPSGSSVSSYTLIYGNKVALLSISSDLTPYGVIIEDEGNASMQRLLFEQLWASL